MCFLFIPSNTISFLYTNVLPNRARLNVNICMIASPSSSATHAGGRDGDDDGDDDDDEDNDEMRSSSPLRT